MALPKFFEVLLFSDTAIEFSTDSANNTLVVTMMPWKFDSNGAREWGAEVTFTKAATDLSANSFAIVGSEYDNSANKWIGADFTFEFEADIACTPTLHIQASTNAAGGDYPDDQADFDPSIHPTLITVAMSNENAAAGVPDFVGGNFQL